ncbi:MAG: isoleucine--tRNA ligase [Deltaproteobacteria bacterium]|nr:isoleucine--tRNA ligase [Deltaproteobacteria bacterium]
MSKSEYKSTLNLPQTAFPMKANLPQREPEILKRWEETNLYPQIVEQQKEAPAYLLHDGPPYANGHIHLGHALNKILKDIIVRSRNQMGFRSEYVPGWDCHGLPIEHQVDKELGPKKKTMTQTQIRSECRKYAKKFVEIQKKEFQRLGVMGDWEHPYLTMDPSYEATIVREFGQMVRAGGVYRGRKPIHWCVSCQTALAEAEVEYENHRSASIYVKFPVISNDKALQLKSEGKKFSFVIWTTTPWTLPANRAIAVHPQFHYLALETDNELLILAEELLEVCKKDWLLEVKEIPKRWLGSELEGIVCSNPLTGLPSPVILGEHVHAEQGTGVVHTAPGHGQEDFEIGQRYKLEVFSPLDDQGRFTREYPPLEKVGVFEANPKIVQELQEKEALIPNRSKEIEHSYPHCWRCKKPVIFRATSQWFLSMSHNDMRKRALQEIEKVEWVPPWGKDRIRGMLESRPDWCLSRQRSWGVPIVAFHCQDCGEAILNPDWIEHVAKQIEKDPQGTDLWFSKLALELLPSGAQCLQCHGSRLEKEMNILDVWFDSGVSYAAVVEKRFPRVGRASLYLEGSDQHRGWFQSALLTALATQRRAPYDTVLTHGFTVDGEGRKMSKSFGNVIAPEEVIREYGSEILRLWVTAEDYTEDVRISGDILKQLADTYRRIRNTCRYLLGNLFDFDPQKDRVSYSQLLDIDRFMLHQLHQLLTQAEQAYTSFQFHKIYHSVHKFCVTDLSAFYLDILKDRLYTSAKNSRERRSAQTVLYDTLIHLVQGIAPILPFTAEEVWSYIPNRADSKSVHLSKGWKIEKEWHNLELASQWETLLEIRGEILKPIEIARQQGTLGSSLEARVEIKPAKSHLELLQRYRDGLPTLLIVSQVNLVSNALADGSWKSPLWPEMEIRVDRARGSKCQRCWNYKEEVGTFLEAPDLCGRCFDVIKSHSVHGSTGSP